MWYIEKVMSPRLCYTTSNGLAVDNIRYSFFTIPEDKYICHGAQMPAFHVFLRALWQSTSYNTFHNLGLFTK